MVVRKASLGFRVSQHNERRARQAWVAINSCFLECDGHPRREGQGAGQGRGQQGGFLWRALKSNKRWRNVLERVISMRLWNRCGGEAEMDGVSEGGSTHWVGCREPSSLCPSRGCSQHRKGFPVFRTPLFMTEGKILANRITILATHSNFTAKFQLKINK